MTLYAWQIKYTRASNVHVVINSKIIYNLSKFQKFHRIGVLVTQTYEIFKERCETRHTHCLLFMVTEFAEPVFELIWFIYVQEFCQYHDKLWNSKKINLWQKLINYFPSVMIILSCLTEEVQVGMLWRSGLGQRCEY